MAGPYVCDSCGVSFGDNQRKYAGHHYWCVKKRKAAAKAASVTVPAVPSSEAIGTIDDSTNAPAAADIAGMRSEVPPPPPDAAPTVEQPAGSVAGMMDATALQNYIHNEIEKTINEALAKAQAARAAAIVPKGPAGPGVPPPPPEEEFKWQEVAKKALDMFDDWRKDRRLKTLRDQSSPSLQEQVGSLAIQNYVMRLSSEAGKAGGKALGKIDITAPPDDNDESMVAVQATMLQNLQQSLSDRDKRDAALIDALEGLKKSINPPSAVPEDHISSEHDLAGEAGA